MIRVECPACDHMLDYNYRCSSCGRSFAEEVRFNYLNEELTQGQMNQQDFVDNECLEFLKKFVPEAEHDIEQLSIIRNAVVNVLDRFYGKSGYDIYPWLLEPVDEGNNLSIQERYMTNPDRCPYCSSGDIVGGVVEVDGRNAWQPITCSSCDKTWTDLYELAGIEEE